MAAPPATVPLLAERVAGLAASLDFPSASHSGKALTHAVEQLPRDLLFGMTDAALRDVALTAMSLLDRPRPTAKTLRDPLGRYTVENGRASGRERGVQYV